MNLFPISTIIRREVRETLSDWRIVTPIVLLTFFLPQLLVAAADQVVRFVGGEGLAERLVPFAALLVGFVPASFALITALESFVGERERNTLESLLAMPLSDRELYIGKLCSALITPLGSSMTAMLVFLGLLIGFQPELYFAAMTLPRLLLLFMLIGCIGLVLVTGAVVISSHITTVRAANLMSSFLLLPMAGVMQLAAILIINDRWPVLWLVTAILGVLAALLTRVGMRSFSREELLSREHRQGSIAWDQLLPRLGRGAGGGTFFGTAPSLIIARRELTDVLTDWRVLVPMGVLTLALPLALAGGVRFAVGFVPDAVVLASLVPFAALLVGFVPASFALISALESFVGERERNSLESLLAMPMSDRALYMGKLVAALIVPTLASLLGMMIFLALIRIFFADLYTRGMNGMVLIQISLMISTITLLMVAGAVVISSHTSSVRAATLLASGILVPTSVVIQLTALLFIARRYDLLWYLLAALAVIAVALVRSGLMSFNREEILSREHEDLSLARIWQTYRTFLYEYQPAGVAPAAYVGLPFAPGRFYRRELGPLLRELRLPILVVLLGSLAALGLGGVVSMVIPEEVIGALLANLGAPPAPGPELALRIFANNIRVAILSNLFAIVSFGIFAFLVPVVAFAQVGLVAATLGAAGGNWLQMGADSPLQFLIAYVLPHGLVELPTFMLSAAIGLRIGAALLAQPPGFSAGQNLLWALAQFVKLWLLVMLPLVALAAAIEGFVTPLIIRALY
jgi:uncharacterized membrane protein SpoIIM required for sporulation/ABC-type transport system involved in multi-copper enzyme maturation permease subunit